MSEQIIDDPDVAVLSGLYKGVVCRAFDTELAGFEHALHIRQSTVGSVSTECVKSERHLNREGKEENADGGPP
jgi:hypothetical protein